jgi:2-keto-4-pentenoate hydratase/2-oxohepta-3-ene-1,7-dioic acid hydratase in catechol pathway
MRLVSFLHDHQVRIGAWIAQDRTIVDLARAAALRSLRDASPFASMQALIESGAAGLDAAHGLLQEPPEDALLDTASVQMLSPVPRPIQMRDALAFELHLRQAKRASARMRLRDDPRQEEQLQALQAAGALEPPPVWFRQPIYYKGNRFTVVGDGHDVQWPAYSKVLDYELELGIFIGRTGKDIPVAQAASHIFGYTVYNDVSARDAQADEMAGMLGPAKGKDFDTGNVIGPCIVTADEIGDPYALEMTARVNGVEWSRGNSASMRHRFEDIIAHVSASETLHAGEFIGSGTVGNGCGFELGRYPQPGDEVELEIARIGKLRNRFVRTAA